VAGEVVPFGKYKGQPIEVMLADQNYLGWVTAQPSLMQMLQHKHVAVFNLINIGAPQSDDTPEHNALQVKFLDPVFQQAFFRVARGHSVDFVSARLAADADERERSELEKEIERSRETVADAERKHQSAAREI
jgi:hypothetical protein